LNLTKGFFEETVSLNLQERLKGFEGHALTIFARTSRLSREGVGDTLFADFPVFWKESKMYWSHPITLVDQTLQWMGRN
jgi:hypothetical protein